MRLESLPSGESCRFCFYMNLDEEDDDQHKDGDVDQHQHHDGDVEEKEHLIPLCTYEASLVSYLWVEI